MATNQNKQKMLDVLISVNTAIKNMRVYPASSAKIKDIIDKIHQNFSGMLQAESPLVLQKSGHGLLLGTEELKKPGEDIWQVDAFAKLLREFGIDTLIIEKNISKEELTAFLETIAKMSKNIQSVEDLRRIFDQKKITHVLLNKETVPAPAAPEAGKHQILSPLDITDDKIIQSFLRANKEEADEIEKIEQAVEKADFLLKTFQSRLADITQPQTSFSVGHAAERIAGMLSTMDKVTSFLEKAEKERIAEQISGSISALGPDIVEWLKNQNVGNFFGGALTKHLFKETSAPQPAETLFPDLDITAGPKSRSTAPQSDGALNEITKPVMLAKSNITKHAPQQTEDTGRQNKTGQTDQAAQLKEKVRGFLRDDPKSLFDEKLLADMPVIFDQLDAEKEHEMMASIISRLVNSLTEKNEDIRAKSSAALADIIGLLTPERRIKLLERLSPMLVNWIKFETSSTYAYRKICDYLKNLTQSLIEERRFGDALPILDVFSCISAGIIEKNDKAHEISLNIVRSLATESNINVLLKTFNTSAKDPEKQFEAGSVLVRLGDLAMNRILDVLRGKTDSDERVRIIKLFLGLGQRAIPVIRDRLSKPAPWYYLRNMAYIMGHVGNESSAESLKPLLIHENKQLRNEALRSIYKTGGAQRGPILLEVLAYADDQFKLDIVEALGNAKSAEAVPELLKMLEERKAVSSDLRDDFEEKICVALGFIGAPEALPLLKKISKTSFISRYAKKVKIAAGLAAVSINKKQEEMRKKAEAGEKPITELSIPLDEKESLKEKQLNQ
ncbi:MAG TPA: hypothetical protein P5294_08525 [Smithellaceae bacterium]|nr:hypothetical protein [Smithellaceae bacterium]HRS89366.1 hypothetical protein [Smithellaceae bacterium]HRV26571.1 hypothetical protein [Smithellaceae bacterium]